MAAKVASEEHCKIDLNRDERRGRCGMWWILKWCRKNKRIEELKAQGADA